MESRVRAIRIPSVLLVSLLAFGVGCPKAEDQPDGGTADGGGSGFTRCNLDSECPGTFRCDRELHRCVCTSDASCPSGLFCNAFTGQCVVDVPGCTSDSECDASQYCDVGTRTCRTRKAFCEPCEKDVECGGSADRCFTDETFQPPRSYCGQACNSNSDCPAGGTCQQIGTVKSCWPEVATCEQFKGCTPDSGQACQSNPDCTEGDDQVCDKVQGTCVARVPTCPFGTVCSRETERCEAACTTDDECNAHPDCQGTTCRCTNNQCAQVFLCDKDDQCEQGKVCVVDPGSASGECVAQCQDNAECPLGSICAGSSTRKTCRPACISNADCELAQNCVGGTCQSGCQTVEVCDACQVCKAVDSQRKDCQQAQGVCQTCATMGQPAGCYGLSASTYCCIQQGPSGTPVGYAGFACANGTTCPKGFECVQIVDQNGDTIANNCFPSTAATCNEPTCP